MESMIMSHLTLRPGTLESMERFTNQDGGPVATPESTVLFGFNPLQPWNEQWVYMLEHGIERSLDQQSKRAQRDALAQG